MVVVDPFLHVEPFLMEEGLSGDFKVPLEAACKLDPNTVVSVEVTSCESISRMSAVETPMIFSLLSGESPQVERDSCASVYRQSALFRRQFEHGIPLSHFR